MRILAVDVGTGTQDILLFDSEREVENNFKMVMPSPTVMLAQAIRAATRRGDDLLLTGVLMGGGPCGWAVEDHLKAGHVVYATPDAARTFNDDLNAVVAMGVTLVSEDEAATIGGEVTRLRMADFNYPAIAAAFDRFGVNLDRDLDAIAVAVFDHGHAPPDVSDRLFRFRYLEERLRAGNRLSTFAFLAADVPPIMTRMQAVAATTPRDDIPLLLMDTAPAAVLGALQDQAMSTRRPVIVANIGNFHCLAFRLGHEGVEGNEGVFEHHSGKLTAEGLEGLLDRPDESSITNREGRACIEGVFEHHTGKLTAEGLEGLLDRLAEGSISNKEVFESSGHGAVLFCSHAIPPSERHVVVTGPQRGMLRHSRWSVHFATPFGDMMLAGCYGLVRAYGQIVTEAGEAIDRALAGGGGRSL